jgi:hypothetical protein
LSWRVVAASAAGTSHAERGTPCEDSCWAAVDRASDGKPILSMFVSDGAGSALKGGEGAEIAIQAVARFVEEKFSKGQVPQLDNSAASEILSAVRFEIASAAKSSQLSMRDFACTLLGLVSTLECTLVFQIGDGGIVLNTADGLELAVVPMSGEYANMTHFVTDDDAISALTTKTYRGPVVQAAVFSDGLQRLLLDLSTNTPHLPPFVTLFDTMSKASDDQEDQLQAALLRFLNSDRVNQRTDDDKTLVLAIYQA